MDFKTLFDQAPFGMVVTTIGGNIILANNSFCKILEYSMEELLNMDYKNIVHPDYLETHSKAFNLLVKGDVPFIQIEMKCLSRQGKLIKVFYKAHVIQSEKSGSPECIAEIAEVGWAQNLQPLQMELNGDDIYLDELMNKSPDLIYFKNKDSQIIRFSNSFQARFPSLEGGMIGKTDFDFFTNEHAQQAFDDEQKIIKTGLPIIDIEEKETTLNGNVTWVATSKMPLRNNLGEIVGTFGISRDITYRKLQEVEIKEKNNILSAITSNMPIVVYKYTKKNGVVVLYGNPALRSDFENSKMVRLSIFESLPLIINKISSQKNNLGYMTFPSTTSTKDEERYFENFVFENELDHDEYIGLALDITNRKLTEQNLKRNSKNLEKLNKELNQFSYIVSHDLKAPLRAVTNLSEWIEEDLKDIDSDDTKENLKLMRGRIRRMENLINGILAYSRVSRTVITYEKVDVKKLVHEVIESLSIPEKFQVIVAEELPVVEYPSVNLEQIFTNLISNAIKYHNKPDGRIEIGYREVHDFYEFWVVDDGPGIADEYHDKVFQIFQTLQARDTVESTGIGLTIVKKIVEERGGNIWIESKVGKGSKFLFTTPIAAIKNVNI